jgi:hypothetical protein
VRTSGAKVIAVAKSNARRLASEDLGEQPDKRRADAEHLLIRVRLDDFID